MSGHTDGATLVHAGRRAASGVVIDRDALARLMEAGISWCAPDWLPRQNVLWGQLTADERPCRVVWVPRMTAMLP